MYIYILYLYPSIHFNIHTQRRVKPSLNKKKIGHEWEIVPSKVSIST